MTAELEWLYSTCTSKDKILLGAMITHSSKLITWKSLNMRGWKTFKGNLNAKIFYKLKPCFCQIRSTEQLWKKKLS